MDCTVRQAVTGITALGAALLFGWVVDRSGTAAALWLSAVAGVGATIGWWLVTGPQKK